jgi:hypothetical protein
LILHVAALLAANVCLLAAGAGTLRLAGFWWSRRELLARLGLAYMCGVALVGVLATLGYMAGLSWAVWQVLVLCLLLAASGLLARGAPQVEPPTRNESLGERMIARGVALLIGAYAIALLAKSIVKPLNNWDAWVFWTMKARALVLLHGLDAHLFASKAYGGVHLDYPLLIPSIEAIDFHFMGHIDTAVVHAQFALLFVGFLAATRELLREHVPPALLWPGLLLVAMAPALGRQLVTGYADVPLAFFFALAALAGWRYLVDGDRRFLVPFAILAGGAFATKFEGTPFVAVLVVLMLVLARVHRRPVFPVAAASVTSAVAIVPWRLWVKSHDIRAASPVGKTLDPSYLADHASRLEPIARSLASVSIDHDWLLVLPLALLAAAVALVTGRGRATSAFTLCLIGGLYAALAWAYLLSTVNVHWYLRSSADRVISTVIVSAAVFVPVLAAELAQTVPSRRSAPA